MKQSRLQLIRYLVPEISCSANPKFDPNKAGEAWADGDFSVEVSVTRTEAQKDFPGNSWSMQMIILQKGTDGKNIPYELEIALIGYFACRDGLADQEERFVRINGSTMLYGAAREIIRSVTTIGPWGEIMLPTISFYEKDPNQKEEVAAASKIE